MPTKILECKSFPKAPATVPMSVVLRDFGEGHHHRFVTHCRNDNDGSFFWGHYFSDETLAREDAALDTDLRPFSLHLNQGDLR